MKSKILSASLVLLIGHFNALAQPVYVDLSSLLDSDVFLEQGGMPIGDPLTADNPRLDAQTLPAFYANGEPATTQDGRTSFLFAPLKQSGLDAVSVNGQTLDIANGNYRFLDLALLSAGGAFGNPFTQLDLQYEDGSTESKRFGPVAGWFQSPSAYENIFYRYTDDSNVEPIVSFHTHTDEENNYIYLDRGNGNAGGNRFVDGTGYVLYWIDGLEGITEATLGVTVGNNFVISIATDFYDPEFSFTEGYDVLANSMDLYDGFEHRSLGNLKQYTFDLAPYLAEGTGEIYLLLTDATPANGWGPYIENIDIFTGEVQSFEETIAPVVNTNNVTVHAMFQTDGGDDEKPFLYENSGSGPSNRNHRFADGNGSITYRFDLADDVNDANLVVDMANNFVVSLAGPSDVIRYAQMTPATADEAHYLIDGSDSITGNNYRFADGSNYMVYMFNLPNDITSAVAQINVGNQFVVEIASGTNGAFELEMDWVAENGVEIRDNTNLDTYSFDLASYLQNNTENIILIRLSDGIPLDGWGPYLTGITIVNQADTGGENQFQVVLNSMDLFGEDIHNEYNKGYYEIDLESILQNNPTKEFFVKFTDGSTADGWGPGIFWMAVYSGELEILSDRYVFNDLKTTTGNPANRGVALLHRRYELDSSKTLNQIVLPQAEDVYLLGATLVTGETTDITNWMLHSE